jgi:hypothetical protein
VVVGHWFRVAIGAVGVALAAVAAPVAAADPTTPADPPVPTVTPAPTPAPAADPAHAAVTDAALSAQPGAAPAADPAAIATPPDGVQHLPSPDSLPPGTTQDAPDHPTAGLLREVWHALRDGDMSGPDALKLLAATRPVDQQKLAGSKPSNHDAPAAPVPDASQQAGAGPADPATAVPAPAPLVPAPAS